MIYYSQLERLRTVKGNGYDEEHERPMNPLRPIQTLNSRNVVCSFRYGLGDGHYE